MRTQRREQQTLLEGRLQKEVASEIAVRQRRGESTPGRGKQVQQPRGIKRNIPFEKQRNSGWLELRNHGPMSVEMRGMR